MLLLTPQAQAKDRIIINGTGCQVTEEDAIGIFLHSNLYLESTSPTPIGALDCATTGSRALEPGGCFLQAAQLTSKQYMIKHAGMTDIFVPYDDGSYSPYDMRGLQQYGPDGPGRPASATGQPGLF